MKRRFVGAVAASCMAFGALGAFAASAGAAPNPNSAAGMCGPPGQTISQVTPNPTVFFGGPPGQAVKADCAPGQQSVGQE